MVETPKRRDLSRVRIIEVAARLLADEGESALTMRRLAEACGVTPMAIYHHVPDKEAVLELAINHVIEAALPAPASPAISWREELVRCVAAFRNALIRNPGAGHVFVRRAIVGRGTAATTETMFRLLSEGGVSGDAIVRASDAITLVVLGSIVNELTRPPAVRERLAGHLPPDETPFMSRYLTAYAHRDPEERFLKALGWLLDGVEAARDRGS